MGRGGKDIDIRGNSFELENGKVRCALCDKNISDYRKMERDTY